MTCPGYRGRAAGQDASTERPLPVVRARRRGDADRRLAAAGQLAPVVARQLQRFDVDLGHRAAGDHQPADRRQQGVVADVGRDGRDAAVPVLVAQPQRLDRPAGVDGGLEHGRVERSRPLVTPCARDEPAPGGALRERHHRVAGVQPGGDGGHHLGQLAQLGAFDRDDLDDARHHLHRAAGGDVGAGHERQRRGPPPGGRQRRADGQNVQPGHVVADHQHARQVADRPAGDVDLDAEAPQQQSAVDLPRLRPARDHPGQQRQRGRQQHQQGDPPGDAQRDDQPPSRLVAASAYAVRVAGRPWEPGVVAQRWGAHQATRLAASVAAEIDRSLRR